MCIDRDDPTTWPCLQANSSSLTMWGAAAIVRLRLSAAMGRSASTANWESSSCTSFRKDFTAVARASALAAIDRRHHSNALIVADLSNDATYAEVLYETFGPRVIGLQISRHGDGMQPERRPVKHGLDARLHRWPHLSPRTLSISELQARSGVASSTDRRVGRAYQQLMRA